MSSSLIELRPPVREGQALIDCQRQRSLPIARLSLEFTVPTGTPSASAVSSRVRIEVVPQHDHGALVDGERPEAALELVPVVDGAERIESRSGRALP